MGDGRFGVALKVATDFLPASAAKDEAAYARFVTELVRHCEGKVRYWQCNNEPSNAGLWSGVAADYAAQAQSFAAAVPSADAGAEVVLGGCGYDVLSAAPDGEPRKFFDEVLASAGDAFDLFAVHLYDDPARIPAHIADVRTMMRRHGVEKPVVVGEYGGPTLLGFPRLEPVMQQIMMEAFSGQGRRSTAPSCRHRPRRQTARRCGHSMRGWRVCRPSCRCSCRVVHPSSRRSVIASRSVRSSRVTCWRWPMGDAHNVLEPRAGSAELPRSVQPDGVFSDKVALMDFEGTTLSKVELAGQSFRRLAAGLRGATSVRRIDAGPGIVAVAVERGERGPLHVIWTEGEAFSGEDAPLRPLTWTWRHPTASIVDALGVGRWADAGIAR